MRDTGKKETAPFECGRGRNAVIHGNVKEEYILFFAFECNYPSATVIFHQSKRICDVYGD